LHALAECSLANPFKSLFEAAKRLPCSSRFEDTSLPFIFCGSLIRRICMPNGTRPYVLLSVRNHAFRFCNAIFKNSLELLGFLRWQAADIDSPAYYAIESSDS
jgi:hypothetical protein